MVTLRRCQRQPAGTGETEQENVSAGLSEPLAPAGRLIAVVDDLGVKLVVTGDSEVVSSNSLVLAVKKVDGTKFPPTSVDIYSTDDVQVPLSKWS